MSQSDDDGTLQYREIDETYEPLARVAYIAEVAPSVFVLERNAWAPQPGRLIITRLPRDNKYGTDELDCEWNLYGSPDSDSELSDPDDPYQLHPSTKMPVYYGEVGLCIVDKVVTEKKDNGKGVEFKLSVYPCKTFRDKEDPMESVASLPKDERKLFVPLTPSRPDDQYGAVPEEMVVRDPLRFPDGPWEFRLTRPTWVMAVKQEFTISRHFRFSIFNRCSILPPSELGRLQQYAEKLAAETESETEHQLTN